MGGGIKNPTHFQKKWDAQNKKKMGERLVGAKKYRFLFFKKEKRWGENGSMVKIPHYLKMGVKKKPVGAPTVFLTKNPPSSL